MHNSIMLSTSNGWLSTAICKLAMVFHDEPKWPDGSIDEYSLSGSVSSSIVEILGLMISLYYHYAEQVLVEDSFRQALHVTAPKTQGL